MITSFFFSYDESGSTAARDLSLFAIAEGLRPEPSLGRSFEFLNAEQFDPSGATEAGPFEVSMGLLVDPMRDIPVDRDFNDSLYALGVNVSGPTLSRDERPNAMLTLLVDVSGSMESSNASETRSDIRTLLDVAKFGLSALSRLCEMSVFSSLTRRYSINFS